MSALIDRLQVSELQGLSRRIFAAAAVALFLAQPVSADPGSTSSEIPAQRGLVTSGLCPLTCRDLNVPQGSCREWQGADRCYVEDLTQPAGHRSIARISPAQFVQSRAQVRRDAQDDVGSALQQDGSRDSALGPAATAAAAMKEGRRGLVTSASCPYTCKDARLPKDLCREWTDGTKCYTEDFTQPPGHRSMVRVP